MNNIFDFTPSKYQQDIFDFVQHGVGNAVVKASAGSGKTKTIVSAMKLVPTTEKCLFIAFNKSIVEELKSQLTEYSNCTIRTVHGLGYSIIKSNLKDSFKLNIDEYKYRTFIKDNIYELSDNSMSLSVDDLNSYLNNIATLINFSRSNIAQSIKEIETIARHYDIICYSDECEVTLKCLEWGKTHLDTIDYGDMVWLPYELSLNPKYMRFDRIFFDEAQDASKAYVELLKRCFKRGTRFVAVADDKQAINMFAGSSEDAFDFLCNYPNTKIFDLPVTYRCDKKIVELANTVVDGTIARDDADEGTILNDCHITDIQDGDMVLCRSKAPLVKLYVKLLRKNIKCYFKGEDIGENLLKLINSTKNNVLHKDLSEKGVFSELYLNMIKERNKIMENFNLDMYDANITDKVLRMYDDISTLYDLCYNSTTKVDLIFKLTKIFKNKNEGICLSTIHKAKGLESDNVFILCNSCLPGKNVKHEWQKLEERNIQYVAYTRAKHKLGFVSEKEIPPSGSLMDNDAINDDIHNIELIISKLYDFEPTKDKDKTSLIKFKVKNAKPVTPIHENDNKIQVKNKELENAMVENLNHMWDKIQNNNEDEDIMEFLKD